jgi:hypothetical protein
MESPRPTQQRIADALARFTADHDCWMATARADRPHLVPLSFIWHRGRFHLAIPSRSRSADNVRGGDMVRLALGTTRDVILVDGKPSVLDVVSMPQEVLDRFIRTFGWDLRASPGYVGVVVTPRRVLAWRQENEIAGRTVMRAGRWLVDQA